MTKKFLLSVLGLGIASLAGTGCVTLPQPDPDKLQVVTSFYPMYYFASQIGGDKANVTNLTPAGAEPHDYELTPQDVAVVHDSQLLILNGGQLEPWANDITSQLSSDTVVATAGQDVITNTDPHVWLSPKLAMQQVKKITLGFIQADAANSAYYLGKQDQLLQQLAKLDTTYQTGLTYCTSHDIITTHVAFGYLANDYGLNEIAISGLSPDEEPTPARLAEIVQFAKDHQVHYIFFESLVSPKLAETIASEIGAQTLVLNPIEGLTDTDIAQEKTYVTVMQDNLTNLRAALQCQ